MASQQQQCSATAWDAEAWDLPGTVTFIQLGGYRSVALQLPDDMLRAAPKLAAALQALLPQGVKVAVLADSAFNPEAVDEVAAQHMMADCVVHYGRASLAATASLPVFYVFPRTLINTDAIAAAIAQHVEANVTSSTWEHAVCVLIVDQGLVHASTALQSELQAQQGMQGWHIVLAQPTCISKHKQTTRCAACQERQCCCQPVAAQNSEPCGVHSERPAQGTGAACTAGTQPAVGDSMQGAGTTAGTTAGVSSSQNMHQLDVAGYTWQLPVQGGETATQEPVYCWVGPSDAAALQALQVGLGTAHRKWLCIQPDARMPSDSIKGQDARHQHSPQPCREIQEGVSPATAALIKRRYFLVEKARAACILGVLVGTLGTAGLTQAMSHLRNLISAAGKRSYTVLVGKPSSAKLANFPEVEVWVQLSDPLGALLDSRPFLAPLITPHEAVIALTGQLLTPGSPAPLGLAPLLVDEALQRQQLAAAHAAFAATNADGEGHCEDDGLQLAVGQPGGLALQVQQPGHQRAVVQAAHGAQFLAMRSWQGVDAPVAGAAAKAPAAAVEGLKGRAAAYVQEPTQ